MGKVPPTSASLTLSFRTHISVRRSPGSESHCLAGWLEWQKTLPPLLKDTFREDSDYRDLRVLPCWLPTWEVPNWGHGVSIFPCAHCHRRSLSASQLCISTLAVPPELLEIATHQKSGPSLTFEPIPVSDCLCVLCKLWGDWLIDWGGLT